MYIIGGKHKKRRLFSPSSQDTRPSSGQLREALFNICQWEIKGASFLDLFAGSGGVGLEALSRGAVHATFVESSRQNISCIKKNIALLKEEKHATLYAMDVFAALKKFQKENLTFDIIFADPPYGTTQKSLSNEVLNLIDKSELLSPKGMLFLEDAEKASSPDLELENLTLISSRKLGPAVLRQYGWKE